MATTKMDWEETPTEHLVKVKVTGLKKEELHVEIEHGKTLVISGSPKRTAAQTALQLGVVPPPSKREFLRKFDLPEDAKEPDITAKLESGKLTVVVPKQEPKKKVAELRTIQINDVGSDDQQAAETSGSSGGDGDQQTDDMIGGRW